MFFFVTLLILTDFMKAASESFKVIGPAAHLNVEKGEDVVLPCSLRPNISAEDMRVEWSKLGERSLIVHLYQGRADRNGEQFEDYRGRTSLFKEELKNGNTSLKLSAVQPSDEGLYNCLIESSSEYDDVNIEVQVIGSPLHRKRELSPVQCSAIAYMRLNSETVRNEWDLKKYKTSEAGYRRLIPAITNCRKAQLAGFNLTKGLITILRKHLQSENTSLKELDLSYTNLQGSMLKELSDGLKRLETLRLMRCKLSNESVDTVQSILQSENSLKNLDLSNNEFQDSRMETLCAGLRSPHCKLETLK
ncbi:butyrophilin subfamily 2 member A2-like [Hoplias malabaricus]|uniref:butyrophilin subfamily 2 member A2-like n=1 Tax=Hoplias malabaricus TaxID=27720 RepID=UPI00346367C3